MRTGFRGFVIWEAGSEFHDRPGWLYLLLVRAQSTVLSSVPERPLSCQQTAFLILCEMENGIFRGLWCRKAMNGRCQSLPAFTPAWCLCQGPLLVFAPCTPGLGARGVALHSAKDPLHAGWFSAISAHIFGTGFANSFGVVSFYIALSDTASWALRHEFMLFAPDPLKCQYLSAIALEKSVREGKKGNNYTKYTVL